MNRQGHHEHVVVHWRDGAAATGHHRDAGYSRPPRRGSRSVESSAGERVLELGCGGGHLAREAAQFVGATGQVCAVDISPDQIMAAQACCADLAWVECRIADITALPYA